MIVGTYAVVTSGTMAVCAVLHLTLHLLSASAARLNAKNASFNGCDTELVGSAKTIDWYMFKKLFHNLSAILGIKEIKI